MDANTIITLIGSLGFPIVACGGLFWFIVKSMRDSNERIVSAIENLESSIAANTVEVSKFSEVFRYISEKGGEANSV